MSTIDESVSPSPLKWPRYLGLLALAMWVASIALPVWETRSDMYGTYDTCPGLLPLMLGWLALFMLCPAWFANLLFLVILPTAIGRRGLFAVSAAALFIAATGYCFFEIPSDNDSGIIIGRMIGFYLWLGSFVVLAVAHAGLANRASPVYARRRRNTIAVVLTGILLLEFLCPVSISPLERTIGNPGSIAAMNAELARHPSAKEKDKALSVLIDYARHCMGGRNEGVVLQQVEALLVAGADVNSRDSAGLTPLARAASSWDSRNGPLLDLLLKFHPDLNARDKMGWTPLDFADMYRNRLAWRRLIEAGAVPPPGRPKELREAAQLDNRRLAIAATKNRLDEARMAVEAYAEVNDEVGGWGYPLSRAAENGSYAVAEYLLAQGALVRDALARAAKAGDVNMMELLLSYEPDPNATWQKTPAPILQAIDGPNPQETVACLIAYGVDVNRPVDAPPIVRAAAKGNVSVVRLLIEHGADVHAAGSDGKTALAVAIESEFAQLKVVLEQAGARR